MRGRASGPFLARSRGIEPRTSWSIKPVALPLSYERLEEMTGFEPATCRAIKPAALPLSYISLVQRDGVEPSSRRMPRGQASAHSPVLPLPVLVYAASFTSSRSSGRELRQDWAALRSRTSSQPMAMACPL